MYQKKKEGLYFDQTTGRVMEHKGYANRIYWNADMTDYLRRHFATTLNEELAGCLGVSPRTMIRKARELGLQKDPVWLQEIYNSRLRMGPYFAKRKINSGFKKGEQPTKGEFKLGHKLTEEQERKRRESLKRWYIMHPQQAREKAAKTWATRKANAQKTEC